MNALESLPAEIPKSRICHALGVPRHWCYPDTRRRARARIRRRQPRRLSDAERALTLDHLHSARFIDLAPRQVYATLLDEGCHLASISTMYRLLRAHGENAPRRAQRPAHRHPVPRLTASAPDQVWTWDITKLPTHTRGLYLCLYVILDLFSRYAVGWMVSRKENAGLARHLFTQVIAERAIRADALIIHQDRGSPMIAHSFAELMADLGVSRSYSRPRVSNDNAFSESQFKTLKYSPSYPGRFADDEHARLWGREFFAFYNQRPHEGLALFAPHDVYHGRVDAVHAVRQAALDAHYAEHPQRYVNGPPRVKRPPQRVCINPVDASPASEVLNNPRAFSLETTTTRTNPPEVVT